MISRGGKGNFFVDHYEWIVAGVGLVALLVGGAIYANVLGGDDESDLPNVSLTTGTPAKLGVEPVDVSPYVKSLERAAKPGLLASVNDAQANFMASEKRVRCTCGNVMLPGLEKCPKCNLSLIVVNQEDEEQKKREEWAAKLGIAFDDSDADGDGFTNIEEYEMGTNPTDAKSHADYLDTLRVQLPLKKTPLDFYLTMVNKIPAGYRCNFKTKGGDNFSATVGEELVVVQSDRVGRQTKKPTGFTLVAAEKKEKKVKKNGVQVPVDASTVTLKRASDKKEVTLTISTAKPKYESVDLQATLVWERGGMQTFNVITNDEIELKGSKYKVVSVKAVGKDGAEVVVKSVETGKERAITAQPSGN